VVQNMSSRNPPEADIRDHMEMKLFLLGPGYSLTTFGNSGMTYKLCTVCDFNQVSVPIFVLKGVPSAVKKKETLLLLLYFLLKKSKNNQPLSLRQVVTQQNLLGFQKCSYIF